MLPAIEWKKDRIVMIDQRKLPQEEIYLECIDYEQVAEAIEKMVIRGAPAIGVAAAYGVALGVLHMESQENLSQELDKIFLRLEQTRPTARNLFWALERMKKIFLNNQKNSLSGLKEVMIREAKEIEKEDIETCKKIGSIGASLVRSGERILTHCNAGALATAGYGTALGVIRSSFKKHKDIKVYASETRPFLQGARLTCWELSKESIPVVLITDNMAGYLMNKGEISFVVTGADRIASNGDTANKIGTYAAAVLAKENRIPFYVAAPLSTIDFGLEKGSQIPIEERDPDEVRKIGSSYITLPDIEVRNPAFDVTPAEYITAIITEKGIARPPYNQSLRK
ncbi:MAG: S-methyl-5-thioribose-1-phosphate isomerase [Candidatus Aminicenantes bacterium]|nr:S-methyl-5-thioribose-1-phosphate isomerase [Candidatus Aminicenantes bacterium]HHF52002.1 S-methyl-5-thioribose-1-phosphate isomerase [Candidatus Aminicenantes bacterium]